MHPSMSHSPPMEKYPLALYAAGTIKAADNEVIITAKLILQSHLFIFSLLFLVILFERTLALWASVKCFSDRKSIIISIRVRPRYWMFKNKAAFSTLIHFYSPFVHKKIRCTSLKCLSSSSASLCLRGGSVWKYLPVLANILTACFLFKVCCIILFPFLINDMHAL